MSGFITSVLGPMWPNEVGATQTITDQLDANGLHNVAQLTSSISGTGTGSGATMSPRLSVVIGLRTTVPTKAGRGRMYWPAPDSSHTTPTGNLLSSDASAIAVGWQTRLSTFKLTSQPIILHRGYDKVNGQPVTPVPSTYDNVSTVTVGVVFGSQRRRTNRVANAYASSSV